MRTFHVFLSHNSADKSQVEELAKRLKRKGIQPWLDKWNLIPGDPWQDAIEEALDSCRTCAVFIGPSDISPWQHQEMRAAISRRVSERQRHFRVIPVLLPGAERGKRGDLPDFLRLNTWVEFRRTLDDEDAFHRLLCGIRGIEPGPGPGKAIYEGKTPYRGMQFFDVEHAPFFFGREALTEWLLNELRPSSRPGQASRFLGIIGPSGSGKSSLARAGLIDALKKGKIEGSETWPTAICRPGPDPLESLAVALSEKPPDALKLMESLSEDERSLHITTRLALKDSPSEKRLVVLIDQFEELFTLCQHEQSRQAFINNLLYATSAAPGQTVVVIVLRSDFYGRCADYPSLAAVLSDHQILVGPMTEEELRRAVERPAERVGCGFEPGLVELLLSHVQGQPGSLPLLQHALMELWERREGRRLTHAAYRGIGGVEGALELRAEDVYSRFTESEKKICQQVFLRLTQVGEGTEDARRRMSLNELMQTGHQEEEIESVIEALASADARLIAIEGGAELKGERLVEVTHEALIRTWERLRGWIEEDREFLLWRQRLQVSIAEWERTDLDPGALLRGASLRNAQRWLDKRSHDLSQEEREYIQSSAQQRQQIILAQSRQLANQSESIREQRPDLLPLSVLLAVETMRCSLTVSQPSLEADQALRSGLALLPRPVAQMIHEDIVNAVAFSPDGVYLATASDGKIARVWETMTGQEVTRMKHEGSVYAVAFSLDGKYLATASWDRTARVWETTTGQEMARIEHDNIVSAVAFSPDGMHLATASRDNTVWVWETMTGQKVARVKHGHLVFAVAFSPDGVYLATASRDKTARMWETMTGQEVARMKHENSVSAVTFSPDGMHLATASDDDTARVWETMTGQEVARMKHEYSVYAVAFSPDGVHLTTASRDRTIRVWESKTGQQVALMNYESSVYAVAFSPDGVHLATASGDIARGWEVMTRQEVARIRHEGRVSAVAFNSGRVHLATASGDIARVWEVMTPQEVACMSHSDRVSAAAFSPDGEYLATASADTTARVWETMTGREVARVKHEHRVSAVAFSPDGKYLATASRDNTARVWEAMNGQEVARMNHESSVYTVSFSPDGMHLATTSRDGTARVWETMTGQEVARMKHADVVSAVAFSPEGVHLATASWDTTARVWETMTGQEVTRIKHRNRVYTVAFSPDGEHLATASRDGTARVWETMTGREVARMRHEIDVYAVAFSPDGIHLATGSWDGTARVWETMTGQGVARMKHESCVYTVAFSPDGIHLATGSWDGTARVWLVWPEDLMAEACSRLTRNMTPGEWNQYMGHEPYRKTCPNLP